uniref:Uncharacterized protein n=1 Tax=Romanomermis culicivorax TaxID=13658 RepID=A0A915IG56_ROMCU
MQQRDQSSIMSCLVKDVATTCAYTYIRSCISVALMITSISFYLRGISVEAIASPMINYMNNNVTI